MNIAQAVLAGCTLGLERLDAQLLLLHALGRAQSDRAWLLAHDGDLLPEQTRRAFMAGCERRARGEPLAYIVGHKEFFGIELQVDARVLVPRPDTETLVQWAIDLAGDHPHVIDLGTGSGAIAIAVKKHVPGASVEAVDASGDALDVAMTNAKRLGVEIDFRQQSWLPARDPRYDLILSNPPYVPSKDPHLAALKYEPAEALESGSDGLRDIRSIISQAPRHLRAGGWLLLEHGWDQAPAVRRLLEAAGFKAVTSRRDLAGIERCSGGQWLELG